MFCYEKLNNNNVYIKYIELSHIFYNHESDTLKHF